MIQDSIGDMMTRLRNATFLKAPEVRIPKTKKIVSIAQILQQEGLILSFEDDLKYVTIFFKYKQKKNKKVPFMTRFTRISKPGLRVYTNYAELPKVLGGLGISILSTSQGIMTDRQARTKTIGGEILCSIW